tara:strand:- start:73 stop:261 length:189 start_codon:yes stop_codon:yes gene_type:complete
MDDHCQDCIWWLGDASGDQGECSNGDGKTKTIVGRYDSCQQYISRELGFEGFKEGTDDLDFN